MNPNRLFAGVLWLLALGAPALAQSVPPLQAQATISEPVGARLELASQEARYQTAHDSLMLAVAKVRAEIESRLGLFKTSQGTLGGLHRRVKSYASASGRVVNWAGVAYPTGGTLVKHQIVKHRYGVELEKVVYYDAQGRKVLTERYEGRELTRLELQEFPELLNAPVAKWVFIRGDYLTHWTQAMPSSPKKLSYFFSPKAPRRQRNG